MRLTGGRIERLQRLLPYTNRWDTVRATSGKNPGAAYSEHHDLAGAGRETARAPAAALGDGAVASSSMRCSCPSPPGWDWLHLPWLRQPRRRSARPGRRFSDRRAHRTPAGTPAAGPTSAASGSGTRVAPRPHPVERPLRRRFRRHELAREAPTAPVQPPPQRTPPTQAPALQQQIAQQEHAFSQEIAQLHARNNPLSLATKALWSLRRPTGAPYFDYPWAPRRKRGASRSDSAAALVRRHDDLLLHALRRTVHPRR